VRDHWCKQSNGFLVRTFFVHAGHRNNRQQQLVDPSLCFFHSFGMPVNMLPADVPSNSAPLDKRPSLEHILNSGLTLAPEVEDSLQRISIRDCSVSTSTTMTTLDVSTSTKRCSNHGRSWGEFLEALIAYTQVHGHCNVPYYYAIDRNLGEWVNKQRKSRSSLPQNQKDILDSVGFDWQSTQERICKKYFV
jgi:Helicase associated domain